MRKFQIIAVIVCFILSMFSCVKDKYDWDECNPRIFITFDWSSETRPDNDELVNVVITSEEEDDITRMQIGPDGQEVRIPPQNYLFLGYTNSANVTIDETTVSIRQDAEGNYPEPDYFAGGAIRQAIIPSTSDQTVTIPMRRQTRPLIIRVILRGQAIAGFSHITAEISGIAMSRDINNGFAPVDNEPLHNAYITGNVLYDLTQQTDVTTEIMYSDQKNLLGLDGSSGQVLLLTAYYTSGNQNTREINVTSKMLSFHTQNVEEPWVLEFILDLVGELQTDIEDWTGNYLSNLAAYR